MASNPFNLSGRVALITGANSGIGLGFAEGLAVAGADVVLWGRRAERNEAAREQLSRHGGRILAQAVDVADEEQVIAGVEEAVLELGRIDCLIVNAGVQTYRGAFTDIPPDAYHEMLAVNQHGAYFTLREGLRHMVQRAEAGDPGGSVITCGSLAVVAGVSERPAYVAAKGALASMTRAVAVEYGPQGIRANMVLPGRIETGLGGTSPEERAAKLEQMRSNPLPRMGTPADLAGIAVYLMSDASRYHTGDIIVIDGGLSTRLP